MKACNVFPGACILNKIESKIYRLKKLLLATLAMLALTFTLRAQEHNYRSPGYKGNVAYTNSFLYWNGLDTSHGYMFNEHHYLGGGAGVYMILFGNTLPTMVHAFVDYHAYWFKRKSTPVAGMKLGYSHSVHPANENQHWVEIEPNIGWSWGLKSGYGLTLTLGAKIVTTPITLTENSSLPVSVLPTLAFAFEF